MIYCARTHVGYSRKRNEDSFYIPAEGLSENLFIIADGMGGLSYGNAASSATVDAVVKSVREKKGAMPVRLISDAANAANTLVRRIAQKAREGTVMGSTLTLALMDGRQAYIGNVGDSRAYLCGAQALTCLTRDHSYVDELVRAGRITALEARTHPYRHAITRAIGIKERVDIDVFEVQWEAGDTLLLCTDGLTNQVEDAQIERMIKDNEDIEAAADALIKEALDSGGADNITVVLVRNTGPETGEVLA